MHRDVAVQPDQLVEPTGGVAVLLGEIDGRDPAAELVGEIAGRAADAATGIEHLVAALELGKLGELAGRDPTHGVEILQWCEITALEVAEVQASGPKGFRNAVLGEAGCVLLIEAHRWLSVLTMSARRSTTTWG